jgi:transposase
VIDRACPTEEEISLLIQYYRQIPGSVSQRAHSILLSGNGKSPYEISQVLFVAEKTVREWVKRWHERRMSSLFSKNHGNENAAKLTKEQKEEVKKVLASPPSRDGIPKEFWDLSTLRDYIVIHFGVVYESERSYHFLFKASRLSFKLPAMFDRRRNDEGVKKRIEEVREEIKPYLSDPSWVVLCGDETRVTWKAIIRRVWLPKGKDAVLKVHRESQAQNFIGFLNLKTGKPHLYPIPWQNQKEIIKVLKQLLRKYPGKKICLVWDNARFHKGKLIRKALEKDLSSYFLINFPPYAPDTNPQEHVWKWGKDQIANVQFPSLLTVSNVFKKTLMSHVFSYKI